MHTYRVILGCNRGYNMEHGKEHGNNYLGFRELGIISRICSFYSDSLGAIARNSHIEWPGPISEIAYEAWTRRNTGGAQIVPDYQQQWSTSICPLSDPPKSH